MTAENLNKKKLTFSLKSLNGKMALLVILPMLAFAGLIYLSLGSLNNQIRITNQIEKEVLPQLLSLTEVRNAVNNCIRYAFGSYAQANENAKEKYLTQLEEQFDIAEKQLEILTQLSNEKQKNELEVVKKSWEMFKPDLVLVVRMIRNSLGTDQTIKEFLNETIAVKSDDISKKILTLNEQWKKESEIKMLDGEKEASQRKIMMIAISVALALVIASLGTFIGTRLSKQLTVVSSRMSESGSQVTSASHQLSAASQSLSSGATQASSALEETVSALEELSSTVKMNADNAREAASLALATNTSTTEGEKEIKSLIGAVMKLQQALKKLRKLSTSLMISPFKPIFLL